MLYLLSIEKDSWALILDYTMVSVSRASGRSYGGLKAASMSVGAAAANIAGIGASQSLEDAQIQAIEPGQKPGDQSRGQGQDGYRPVRVLQESLANGDRKSVV